MDTWIIVSVVLIVGFFIAVKFIIPAIIKWKALKFLEKVLFPQGENQKDKVIAVFNIITDNRFSKEAAVKYFLKTKGRQFLSLGNIEFSYCAKSYIKTQPSIDLTYFEKVKFHETFINYPKNFEVSESNSNDSEKPVAHPKPVLIYSKEREQAS